MLNRKSLAVLLIAPALLLGACSSGSSNASPSPACTPAGLPAASATFGKPPNIQKPCGDPPKTVETKDLKVGTGPAISGAKKQYVWNYEEVLWSDGTKIDSTFDRDQPLVFSLDQAVPGWQQGLKGMKVGGRRMIVVPPNLAGGLVGRPTVPADATLVFVFDLKGPIGTR